MRATERFDVTERSEAISDKRPSIGPVLAITALSVALGVRFFLIIWKYSINVFFYDQWSYLTPFFRHQPSIAELFFWQHGEHFEGVGLIADKFLYPLTHWNTRVDSFLVGGCIFAAMLLALRLKCKLIGPLSYSDLAIPLIFLTLAQYEELIGTPNPGYSALPLLMMMAYCLALLGNNRLLKYSVVLALNFLLVFTGLGLFMGAVTVGVFLLECYWSWRHMTSAPFAQALTGLAVAAASLASFFIHYTFTPGVVCFEIPHGHFLQYAFLRYPRFMALMFAQSVVPRPLHVSSGITVLGVAILLAAVGIFAWHLLHLLKDAGSGAHLVGVVLLGYCLLFSANASIGRICLGMQAAFASRYVTLLIPAFLAIYFYLLSRSWGGKRNFVLALFVLLLVPAAVRKPWEDIRLYSNGKRDWANCYVRRENIQYCDQSANFSVHPKPEQIADFGHGSDLKLQEKLDYLKLHRLNLFYQPPSK
jgi:hypothetical protein